MKTPNINISKDIKPKIEKETKTDQLYTIYEEIKVKLIRLMYQEIKS